jgi:Predicted membrane protein
MNDLRIPRIVYGFLLAIGVLDWVRRYALLPARMASHFGPHGEVTDWQSKEQFFMNGRGGGRLVCCRFVFHC